MYKKVYNIIIFHFFIYKKLTLDIKIKNQKLAYKAEISSVFLKY
jgi:hypothetical protein